MKQHAFNRQPASREQPAIQFFASSSRFDTPARICQALECQPGDILDWEAD
ncbi:helix-turn-helix domain-containing protein [Klebsiella grimontii]|uniref:helix-turn-helix domain-containing protein n=1 Tax=Klebsiella grimontii TaxID=2058152 RepID=UPI003CFA7D0E